MASSSEAPSRASAITRSLLRTTVFCLAIGLTLWLLGWVAPWWASIVVSLCIGYSITAASLVLEPLIGGFFGRWQIVPSAIVGVIGGITLAGLVATGQPSYFFYDEDYSAPILAVFFGVLGLLYFSNQRKLQTTRAELTAARTAQLSDEKARLETELRLLQAQIEPHFLFNTLSNVVGLIHDQPDAAEAMLVKLTTLLRHSLARAREDTISLNEELELIEALLGINQIRMGDRLSWQIQVADNLLDARLPPMLLQPLVENAVKHGLEPNEPGGRLLVEAEQRADQLIVTVADTGCGINAGGKAGSGVGIANVKQRLAALYGDRGRLSIRDNEPHGVVAEISLPFTMTVEAL